MKKSGFLPRKTPLKTTKQLQARTPLKAARQMLRRTPLKQVSARRVKENQTRAKVIAGLKARQVNTHGYIHCERCGTPGSVHGHELKGRAQRGSITDPANIRLACDPCNEWAEDNPEAAAAEGWKISHKYPKEN